MADETTFRINEALAAQQALRASLGMKEEIFPVEAFVGMISDEIEASRKAGKDDQTIANLVKAVTGKVVTVEDIQRHYAPPEQRHGHHE